MEHANLASGIDKNFWQKYASVFSQYKNSITKTNIMDYYDSIIYNLPGNVYWLDRKCMTLGCNANVLDMFGLKSVEEFSGITFEEMGILAKWPPEATASFKADTLEVIMTGIPKLGVEEPPIETNGRTVYFLTSRIPIFDDKGKVISVAGVSIEITKQKMLEKELKVAKEKAELVNVAKMQFLENMRHDLRTPLSGIIGTIELLKEENNLSKFSEYINILERSTNELMRFFDETLNSIKTLDHNNFEAKTTALSLDILCNRVLALHASNIAAKNLSCDMFVDRDVGKTIMQNSEHVYFIINELLTNAIKNTERGKVSVTAKLMKTDDNNSTLEIIVEDTGVGFTQEEQKKIFLPMVQLKYNTDNNIYGTGMGLFRVKQMIAELHGAISVESIPGLGSKFSCYLPCGLSPVEINKANITTNNTTTPPLYDYSILLVEDNEIAGMVTKDILMNNINCCVTVAKNAATALQYCDNYQYSLIISDIFLPDMHGTILAKKIKQLSVYNKTTPIVAVSAHMDDQKTSNENLEHVLSKPLLADTIKTVIMPLLSTANSYIE
jgi:two-component system aerobic respiration control sensor histidine kinase ArcB